ncbi:hypothetical protein DQ04_11811010 [Trypanosoma grayi]|uniref:hypothetical protein n=1 Tax=Trypanosoma grayi TaxID=71804 RepID=UPI0004F49023|nr:hypothetical protein DQ04_11811010 [Trypanosoma grayi]KEG06879.1 hypothetical protein DQ04_11811010 [Trypanosoma grayi]
MPFRGFPFLKRKSSLLRIEGASNSEPLNKRKDSIDERKERLQPKQVGNQSIPSQQSVFVSYEEIPPKRRTAQQRKTTTSFTNTLPPLNSGSLSNNSNVNLRSIRWSHSEDDVANTLLGVWKRPLHGEQFASILPGLGQANKMVQCMTSSGWTEGQSSAVGAAWETIPKVTAPDEPLVTLLQSDASLGSLLSFSSSVEI